MNTHLTSKDFHALWTQLKASANKRNIPFTLKPTDIDEIGIPIVCPVLGIPLYFHRSRVQDDSISFDRIDSTQGYCLGNVIVVSYRANRLKSDASLDELKKITQFYENLSQCPTANTRHRNSSGTA